MCEYQKGFEKRAKKLIERCTKQLGLMHGEDTTCSSSDLIRVDFPAQYMRWSHVDFTIMAKILKEEKADFTIGNAGQLLFTTTK